MRLGIALGALLIAPTVALAAAGTSHRHEVGLIDRDGVALHVAPSGGSKVLARLVEETQVEKLGARGPWLHVLLWTSVRGWVERKHVQFRKPWTSLSTYRAPAIRASIHPAGPYGLRTGAVTTAPLTLPPVRGRSGRTIAAGIEVSVSGWRQDGRGEIWYRIDGTWVKGDAIQFNESNPGVMRAAGKPVWAPVRGKGMWLTLGTVTETTPDTIVTAAERVGVTHLYVEAAISPLGFHGRNTLGPLVDAAHRHGIYVIAWVYPYLYDIAGDVALTREVASFRTSIGDRFDGIASDLERNVSLRTVRAYSQLVRAYLGSHYLIVGVTYPPASFPTYPFTEVGHDDNVIAPMDYWHQTATPTGLDYGGMRYGWTYAHRYAVDSLRAIRSQVGSTPVAPIGQTFDDFGRQEMGPHAPSASEVEGFLSGARSAGSIGVSFFQWMTATDTEWRAIKRFTF